MTGGDTYNTENVYTVVLNNNATAGSFKIVNKSDPAKIQTVTVQAPVTFNTAPATSKNLDVIANRYVDNSANFPEGFTVSVNWNGATANWFTLNNTNFGSGNQNIRATMKNQSGMTIKAATVTLKNKIQGGEDKTYTVTPVFQAPTISYANGNVPTQNSMPSTSLINLYQVTSSRVQVKASVLGGSYVKNKSSNITVSGGNNNNTDNTYTVTWVNGGDGWFDIANKHDANKTATRITVKALSAAITANNLSVTAANSGNSNIPVQSPAGVTASLKSWGGGNQWFDITTNSLTGNGNIVITQRNNVNNLMKPATILLTNKIAGGANKEITVTPTLPPISATGGAAKINAGGGNTTGSVTALGYKWTIAPATSNGITVSPTSGTGNQKLTFTATGHTDANARTGTFTVTTTDGSPARTVSISATQLGIPRMGNLQVCSSDQEKSNWHDANNSCNTSTKEGYSNWRLPTKEELQAMYNNMSSLENYNGFESFQDLFYWSSTVYKGNNGAHWIVWFDDGYTSSGYDTDRKYVRCVRDM